MTEEQNKLADWLDSWRDQLKCESPCEATICICSQNVDAILAALRREPATEAVREIAESLRIYQYIKDRRENKEVPPDQSAAQLRIWAAHAASLLENALKGKGASQAASNAAPIGERKPASFDWNDFPAPEPSGEFVPVFHAFCPKCRASYEHESIPSEASLRAGSFCPNCKELKYALVGVLHWKLAATDEQKG